jgi:predicted transcriptional regulator
MLSEKKKIYNIILEKEVKEKIEEIARNMERSTSWLVNDVLKKFIVKKGR